MKKLIILSLLLIPLLMGCKKETVTHNPSFYVVYQNDAFPNKKIDVLCDLSYTVKSKPGVNLYEPIASEVNIILDDIVEKYNKTDSVGVFFDKISTTKKLNLNDRIIEDDGLFKDYKVTLHYLVIVKYYAVDTLDLDL